MIRYLCSAAVASWLLAVGPVAIAAQPAATNPAVDDAQLAAWIADLDSNRYLVREEATQNLLAAGVAALDPLLEAANGDRPEPADRAVWVLRKLGESSERPVALAALDRLVQVQGRPTVVAEAREARSPIYEQICQETLSKLGAKMTITGSAVGAIPQSISQVRLVRVELGDDWRGTAEDLKCLLSLDLHHYFRLVGPAVGDAEVKLFESKDGLALLQIFLADVSPEAIDSLKEHQPKAMVYVRNRALLGIQGETSADGVRVVLVAESTGAAAAGIAVGDVITKIEGKPVPDFDRLTARIARHQPGEQVNVTLVRGEDTLTKQVTLGDQPPE